jgi:hypothetical protein
MEKSMTNTIWVTPDNEQAIVSYQPKAIASDRRFAPSQKSKVKSQKELFQTPTPYSLLPTPCAKLLTKPRFSKDQMVCFVGGVGTIRSCRPESGTWTYVVEMELGPEPDMGRVGSETRILLIEADIHAVTN